MSSVLEHRFYNVNSVPLNTNAVSLGSKEEVEEETRIHEARSTIERLARKYLVGVVSMSI